VKRLITEEDLRTKDTVSLARWILGKHLVIQTESGTVSKAITEAEAYDGPNDLACHASKGKTERTAVMFGPAGRWYVYLVYGMHEMLNIVTGPENYPAAILIRGLDRISGPGRLTKALDINRRFNKCEAIQGTGLYLEDRGIEFSDEEVEVTPRIGVNYAGPDWSMRPYRFVAKK